MKLSPKPVFYLVLVKEAVHLEPVSARGKRHNLASSEQRLGNLPGKIFFQEHKKECSKSSCQGIKK